MWTWPIFTNQCRPSLPNQISGETMDEVTTFTEFFAIWRCIVNKISIQNGISRKIKMNYIDKQETHAFPGSTKQYINSILSCESSCCIWRPLSTCLTTRSFSLNCRSILDANFVLADVSQGFGAFTDSILFDHGKL